MKWITASQLEQWARTLLARTELPQIVSDLIRASVPDIASIRFPSGDKGQVRGFDGHLVSSVDALNVPLGETFWEFGTNVDYQSKAIGDFAKRTAETPEDVQRNSTYVFVSPRTWDSSNKDNKIEDFVNARKKESHWKDVRYIDGMQLETWLQANPAVSAWHARNTIKTVPVNGVLSTEEYWVDFAGRFSPPITEDVLLCEREKEAGRLIEELSKSENAVVVAADSPDEALAFAVAAIRKSALDQRLFLEARTVVVDSSAAGRQLPRRGQLVLLLRQDAAKSPSQFSAMGTTLVPLGRHQRAVGAFNLTRPTAHAMGMAMRSMGLDDNIALTYARYSGRSLTALARLIPGGSYDPPAWTQKGTQLLPAILAGAWDSSNPRDRDFVTRLAGIDCSQLEAEVRTYLADADPPFDLEGSVWKVRAPMDAFIHVGRLLGAEQAERLRAVMVEVFSEVEPEPDPNALFSLSRKDSSLCSAWLREGLATTLLLLAAWGEIARVNLGTENGQAFANRTLQELRGLNSDPRLLAALRDELPLLAEAAPSPLLLALEHMLGGDGSAIKPIFIERQGFLSPTSMHTGVLWALETMAWDPEYFRRSVLILARLARLDPGGYISNRPMNSLVEIFIPWAPNTNASGSQRIAVIDEVVATYPEVGWELLLKLLPTELGVSSPTAKPRLREAGAAERKPITNRDYWSFQASLCERAVELASNDPSRWERLIRGMSSFPPEPRGKALKALDVLFSNLADVERKGLWSRVRDEVLRHERFRGAGWALPEKELAPFKALVEKYAPSDQVVTLAQLFSDTGLIDDVDQKIQNAQRIEALLNLISAEGVSAVLRLAKEVRHTYVVLETLSRCNLGEERLGELLALSFADDPVGSLTVGLSGLYRGIIGLQRALIWLESLRDESQVSPETIAALLAAWPDDRETWRAGASLGRDVEAAYWRLLPPRYLKGLRSELLRSTLMRLRYRRPIEALQSCLDRLAEIPTRLLLRLLDDIVLELKSRPDRADTMTTYYVTKALEALDRREDASESDVATREYKLFPLLEYEDRRLRLYDAMARDPAVFHQILRNVFRADDDQRDEASDVEKANAQVSYRLLSGFKRLPGHDAKGVSREILTNWIDEFRRIGTETKRAEITDSYVGKVLAHAPPADSGVWPHEAVRDQIERLSSPKIERALTIERYNMRGAHFRGVYDGGEQERALAKAAFDAAKACEPWPRTADLLRSIGRNWEIEAEGADLEAAQRKLRS
ncbi:hypothetical protein LRC39_23025 [Rhodopseudomonas sp. P1]|uniref:hypothetical protein n=1 Tax=Rhodopseudomonas sp. P1 TaxID=3434357 RepID=UPI0031FCAB0A